MLKIEKEFFTPPQVAALLGTDSFKIHEFIRRGELRAVDLSIHQAKKVRLRISKADLESFLLRRSTSAPPQPEKRTKTSDDVIEFFK